MWICLRWHIQWSFMAIDWWRWWKNTIQVHIGIFASCLFWVMQCFEGDLDLHLMGFVCHFAITKVDLYLIMILLLWNTEGDDYGTKDFWYEIVWEIVDNDLLKSEKEVEDKMITFNKHQCLVKLRLKREYWSRTNNMMQES